MKTKYNLLVSSLIVMLMLATNALKAQTLHVVKADSKVVWTGTKVIGYHQGTVAIKEGKVEMKNQKLSGGYFIIDMTSIMCTDIPASEPVPKKKLETHLKATEFFDVTRYPTAKFEIVEVRIHPDNVTRYLVVGNLTIKGITKRWKIEVEPTTQTDKLFIAHADMRFDRQQFGVAYTGVKDELVHDIVKLDMVIKAR